MTKPSASKPNPVDTYTTPNHDGDLLRSHTVKRGGKEVELKFQSHWFNEFPWIHCVPGYDGVLCFYCAKAKKLKLLESVPGQEPTFQSVGFSNWKKTRGVLEKHENSECHSEAIRQLRALESTSIAAKVAVAEDGRQKKAQACLLKMVSSIRYLLRQGLAFRGGPETDSNYLQLLKVLGESDGDMESWLAKTTNFTTHQCTEEIQNEIAHTVLRSIAEDVKAAGPYGVMVDGTRDVAGKDQECVCVIYVDENLAVHEEFLGLYEQESATGEGIAASVKDVLLRLGLPLAQLRAQTYDGASNMAGQFKGCQAWLVKEQPLALHFRCSAHCVNLALMHSMEASDLVFDAMERVNELGKFFKRCGTFHKEWEQVIKDDDPGDSTVTSLRPLCPTRWTCRRKALSAVLNRYSEVLDSLENTAKKQGEAGCKARNLLKMFQSSATLLGVHIAHEVALRMEGLNQSLQGKQCTVTDMLTAVRTVQTSISDARSEKEFRNIFGKVEERADKLNLQPLERPRPRRPPARYTGPADSHRPDTAEEHYRQAYYAVLDRAGSELRDRFSLQSGSGLSGYQSLESMVRGDEVGEDFVRTYPELSVDRLKVELNMLRSEHGKLENMTDLVDALRSLNPATIRLFKQAETLAKLMLLCPVTSCEAERSFSGLRRVKTWLRSTMGQVRLNSAMVCMVHKERVDSVRVSEVAKRFAESNEWRVRTFGKM